jgi:hypothetical protein
MIKITKENVHSMLASIESCSDPQEYIEKIWTQIEEFNPVILQFSLDELAAFDTKEEQNGFLTGMSFCYEMFRREFEAKELEEM